MAEENLGTAVLKIVVDDDQARTALKLLKRDVENAGISKSTTSSSSRQTKSERDLEVIKEKRFRLARRIEALEDKGVNVSRLRTQLGRLTTAYAERDFTLTRKTARELARQATLAERTEKRRARAARSAKAEADESIRSARGLNRVNIDGSLREVGSPRFVTRGARQGGQAESIDALTAAQKRRYSLDQQISSLEASGVRTDQLRVRLGEVTTAQANRQFGTFNRLADTLDFTLRKERDKLKVLQDQNREYERIGKLNVAPVQGGVAFPGSPAAKAAQRRADEKAEQERRKAFREQLAEGRRIGALNAAPVRGGKAFPGSPAFLDAIFPKATRKQFEQAAKDIREAAFAPLKETIQERRAQQRSLQTAGGGGLTSFLRDVREREEAEKRIAAERAKGYKQASFAENTLQTLAQKRSGLTLRETRERTRLLDKQKSALSGALSSAVIGGAFPLLFGQGGGAAAGGLVGGLFGSVAGQGGGFAGSLAGTLIGQQLDIFNQLAKALQDPVANFKQLVETSNLSSRGLEKYIQVLIDSGRTAEAEAAIRKDISRTIDPVTLAQASAANEQYARTIADVQERLGTNLAGPATQFVGWLEEVIKRLAFLPSPDRGPISDQGRERLSLANRGAGTALGLAGIGIAGASALTGFFPGVLAGGALAATGGAQFALGESQQEQLVLSKLLKGAQQEILAVEQKRIAAQRQLVALAEENAPGQKELTFQLSLLDIESKRKKAKAEFLARDLSTESFQAYKLELDALKLTEKQLRANEKLRLRALGAQRQLDVELTSIKLQGINEEIAATQALGKAERGVARDTLSTVQGIQAGIKAAKDREREIGAQISAARTTGNTEEAGRLVNQQTIAAKQTRLELEKGALALKEAGEQLRENLRGAVVEFTRVRSDPQGLNRFLNSQQRQQRANFDFDVLLPQFRQAQARFTELTGARAPEFTGSTAGVNAAIRDFINSVQNERQVTRDLIGTNQAIAINTAELNKTNADLAAKIKELADKDWTINLTQNSSGQWQASGDAQTQAELRAASTL